MYQSMRLHKSFVESYLRNIANISEHQCSLVKGNSAKNGTFFLRQLERKYGEEQQELCCAFVILERVCYRIQRVDLAWYMRSKGVLEKYIRLVKDMYR